jgi:uncharacterized protein YkwD
MLWHLFRARRRPSSTNARTRTFAPRLEALEDRTLLDAGPQEEYALELINRMRTNPAAELPLLLNSTDPDIQNALSYFQVDQQTLANQWSALTPVPPLAWNDILAGTALAHSQLMAQQGKQLHQLQGEQGLGTRIQSAGYNFALVGENIFATATNVFEAHAAFAIDWGNGPNSVDGIQNPPGHRQNIMNAAFRDVGIGLFWKEPPSPQNQTGPLLITQDFGEPASTGNPFLVGAVFADANGDGFYNPGEGLAGVSVSVSGGNGTFTTTTTAAGGYQLRLPAGAYTATFSGGSLPSPIVRSLTVASDNVWLNVNTSVGTLQFGSATYTAGEASGSATITVTRTGGSSGTVAVHYATGDGSAHAGTDYTATSGTLTFNPGDTSKTFLVPVVNDGVSDGNETVILSLSGPTGGAALGSPTSAVLTITDLPTSSVNGLPAATNAASFTVSWSGSDNSGTGIASFDVFVSDNGGPFSAWESGTTTTSANFTGVDGHRYGFYSIARDNGGNVQPTPGGAQATTRVDLDPPASGVNALPPGTTAASFTVSWSGSDGAAGSGVASFDVFVSDNGGPFTAWLTATAQTSATFNGVPGHTYAFYSVATDEAGNREPTPAGAEAAITLKDPPPVARGIAARLVPVRLKKKTKLTVQVLFADTGALKSQFNSPFQKPAFRNIGVSVGDSNGDGVPDEVVLTARKGKRAVTAVYPG